MSKIDLIAALNGTCVEADPRLATELERRYQANNGASQAATRTVIAREQPVCGPITEGALSSTEGALSSIGTCMAAVLTNLLQIPSLLVRGRTGAHLRRLRCERRAMAPEAKSKIDLLDSAYEATLDRLGDYRKEPWWRKILLKAEGDYVLPYGKSDHFGPHFLRIESVCQWLSDYHVRADLKVLATERILVVGADTEAVRARLAQSYARYTFDDPILAKTPIDTVVCGLVAGALSSLGPSEQMMLSLIRESNIRINRTSAEILAAISLIDSKIAYLPVENERRLSERDLATILPSKGIASISFDLTEAAA